MDQQDKKTSKRASHGDERPSTLFGTLIVLKVYKVLRNIQVAAVTQLVRERKVKVTGA